MWQEIVINIQTGEYPLKDTSLDNYAEAAEPITQTNQADYHRKENWNWTGWSNQLP